MRKALLFGLFALFSLNFATSRPIKQKEDITALDWINSDSELLKLEGVLIPVDLEGYIESFEIVSKTLLDVESVSEPAKIVFFEELINLFYSGTEYFALHVSRVEALKELGKDFVQFLILREEFELAELIVRIFAHDALINIEDSEALELLANYLSSELEVLTDCLTSINYKILFRLELAEKEFKEVFMFRQIYAYRMLKELCSQAPSDYLLRSEIHLQILHLYDLLPTELQLNLQVPLYYRGILTGDEVSDEASPITENDLAALLLGPFKDLNVLSKSKIPLHDRVNLVSKIDPSIIDWFIATVDRTLLNPVRRNDRVLKQDGEDQLWWLRLTDTSETEEYEDFRIQSKFEVLISKEVERSMIMKNKKVAAYAYSGDPDFLQFLKEAPAELLTRVVYIVATEGTAQEFAVFLERASEESIFVLFDEFWNVHQVEQDFAECASLLLTRAAQFPRPKAPIFFKSFVTKKLLKNPQVLDAFQSSDLRVYFEFSSIKAALLDDEIYPQMHVYVNLFADSLDMALTFDLQFFWVQLKRFLSLMEMSTHQFLQYYWLKHDFKEMVFDLDYCYRSFVFLKRWERYHQDEIDAILEEHQCSLDELIHEPSILTAFDEQSLELIKAHILLGKATHEEKHAQCNLKELK